MLILPMILSFSCSVYSRCALGVQVDPWPVKDVDEWFASGGALGAARSSHRKPTSGSLLKMNAADSLGPEAWRGCTSGQQELLLTWQELLLTSKCGLVPVRVQARISGRRQRPGPAVNSPARCLRKIG